MYSGNNRANIIGFIKIKNLLGFKFSDSNQLKYSGIIMTAAKLNGNLTLLDAVDQLKLKNMNFAIVTDENGSKAIGMITLKKIFEKLVLTEFLDDDNQVQFKWNQTDQVEAREQEWSICWFMAFEDRDNWNYNLPKLTKYNIWVPILIIINCTLPSNGINLNRIFKE